MLSNINEIQLHNINTNHKSFDANCTCGKYIKPSPYPVTEKDDFIWCSLGYMSVP